MISKNLSVLSRTLQHHALLQCLAQCTEVTPYLVVMEFCPLVSIQTTGQLSVRLRGLHSGWTGLEGDFCLCSQELLVHTV